MEERGMSVRDGTLLCLLSLGPLRSSATDTLSLSLWFVRVRWLAILFLLGLTALARLGLDIELPWLPVVLCGAALAACNVGFARLGKALARRAKQASVARRGRWFARAQILTDLVAVTALLHYSGGVENPMSTFYVFHVIIASIMLPNGQSYVHAAVAFCLFAGLVVLEGLGALPHYHLASYLSVPQFQNGRFVLGHLGVLGSTLTLSAFFTASLAERLRERERALARTSHELEVLEARKSRFMRVAAHQLRAPLSAIRSLLSVALGQYAGVDEEQKRQMIDRASGRTDRMLELLDDLLALSRLRDAEPARAAPREPVPVDAALDRAADLCREQCHRRGQALQVDLGARDTTVLADPDRLHDVFTNLVSNAVKYTPDGGRVTVSSGLENGSVICEVADTGIGIPEEEQERLFEEFFRASNARSHTKDGTGLGLSIVRENVERLGGAVRCHSRAGEGTRFIVALPVARRGRPMPSARGSDTGDGRGG
jgi:signal transduction histidine kinase